MLTLTAWEPDARHGAEEALKKVTELHSEALLQLHDAAVVSRQAGQKPKTRELLDDTRTGAGSGGFRGTLSGLFFLTIAAAGGALLGSMRDVGITDDCTGEVRDDARA